MTAPQGITSGEVFTMTYPFVQESVCLLDEDGPYNVLRWRPGCHKGENTAEAEGLQVLRVVAVCPLGGRYQDRVFYVQQWCSPDGTTFGKTTVRCCSLRKFRGLLSGYRYPYSLPGQPSVWEAQQAAYEDARARSYAEEEARWKEREAEAGRDMTHACAACGEGLDDSTWPYAYCAACQETQTCAHGVLYKEDCNGCNVQSDFAYDAMREQRF